MQSMNEKLLNRIAEALERLAPPPAQKPDFAKAAAFVWEAESHRLRPVAKVNAVPYGLLKGIDHIKEILLANTAQFAAGLPANNALLWGARGTGKSSSVKAVFEELRKKHPALRLIEILHEDIRTLPALLALLRGRKERFILFCDDLSFESHSLDYKHLKALLDGGVEGKPENVILYATSNRRHLMPRSMAENIERAEIHSTEGIDEKVSLSDRFGLWLGFHNASQDVYFEMVAAYAKDFGIKMPKEELIAEATEWAATRGNRSGRTAYQFALDLAGRMGKKIKT